MPELRKTSYLEKIVLIRIKKKPINIKGDYNITRDFLSKILTK